MTQHLAGLTDVRDLKVTFTNNSQDPVRIANMAIVAKSGDSKQAILTSRSPQNPPTVGAAFLESIGGPSWMRHGSCMTLIEQAL